MSGSLDLAAVKADQVLRSLQAAPFSFPDDALKQIRAAMAAYADVDHVAVAAETAFARLNGRPVKPDGPGAFLDQLRFRHDDQQKADAKAAAEAEAVRRRSTPPETKAGKGYDRCEGRHPYATRRREVDGCGRPLTTQRERAEGCCDPCYERFTSALERLNEHGDDEFYGPRRDCGHRHHDAELRDGGCPRKPTVAPTSTGEPHPIGEALQSALPSDAERTPA